MKKGLLERLLPLKKWVGVGIGIFGIEKLGCGWCCGVFDENNWVGLGAGMSNCEIL